MYIHEEKKKIYNLTFSFLSILKIFPMREISIFSSSTLFSFLFYSLRHFFLWPSFIF